jgi:hypothetical protein
VLANLPIGRISDNLTGSFLKGIMNFTYTLIKPLDGQYGSIQQDGTWNGMINLLANEEIDISMDLALNELRSTVMTFASPIIPFYHALFIKNPAEKFNLMAYIEPMHWLVWVGLFVLLATLPPFLYLAIR